MQTLTLDDVKAAGRAAYEAKTLTAQSIFPECVYEDKRTGCRCVVGSAMTDETLDAIRKMHVTRSRVVNLVSAEIIQFPDQEQRQAIGALQEAHDAWCLDGGEEEEAEFVRLLYRTY